MPSQIFSDPEGTQITIEITGAAGPRPSFISFDEATITISGTPGLFNLGQHQLKVTGTDEYGASTDSFFLLTVNGKISLLKYA